MKNTKRTFVILSAIWIVLLIIAFVTAGHNDKIPYRFDGTYASDEISFTFSGKEKVVATCGDVTVEGTYMNGTTGTKLVVWMDFGDNCPEQLQRFVGDREHYLVYTVGEDYLEIDGVKYYKQ